uniref:Uncharacterized protein n=1 Tax=Panagrolaimus superbus TaxID=310955 RepID=A0A914Y3K7_9BILA
MNCHQLIAAILLINFSLIVARPQYDFGGAEVGKSPAPPPKKELTKVSGDAHPEKAEENSFGGLIKSDTLQPASEPEPPGITTPTPIITPAAEENSVAPAITEPIPPTGDAEKAPESVTPVEQILHLKKVEQAPVVTDVPMAPDANLPPVAEIPKPDSEAQTETSIPEVITIASEKGETIVDSSPSGEKSGMEIEATSIAAEITAEPLVTETSAPVIEQQGETTAADIAPETSSESQTPAPAAENSVAPEAIASPEANSVAEPIPAKEEVSPAESDYTPPLPPAESTTIAAETAVSQDAPKEGISAPEIIEVSTIAQPKTEEASKILHLL